MSRHVDVFDPYADLAERWPDWTVRFINLAPMGELFIPATKMVYLDIGIIDKEMAVAHATVHLDHHMPLGYAMSGEQEREAVALARFRLNREADWIHYYVPQLTEPTDLGQ